MRPASFRLELPAEAAERIPGRIPFVFRHALQDHPLLSIDALAALADRLPADLAIVERFGEPSFVGPHRSRRPAEAGPTPGELIRDIATNGCWADLRHIEQVPGYRELVDDVIRTALAGVPPFERDAVSCHGFVFIAAPSAVTPAHSDPEYNLLMQVRGRKTIALAPLASLDRRQLADWQLRRGYEGGYRRPLDTPEQMESFIVEPGSGLYIPPYAIHAVRNGDEVSVTLSVTCRTRTTRREYVVHAIHRQLRRLRARWPAARRHRC